MRPCSTLVAGEVLWLSKRRGAFLSARFTLFDIWQAADLSGNSPDAIQANAAIAGVSKRMVVDTGDARDLPYPDSTFDVVYSMTAIHNIGDAAGRRKAISEAWRVVKPGGQVLISDIRHARTYLAQLRDLGAIDTASKGSMLLWGPIGCRFSATKPVA